MSESSGGIFDLDARQERLKSLDFEMAQPGFWDKQEAAKAVIDESNSIKGWLEPWRALDASVSNLRALVELLEEEDDDELGEEFTSGVAALAKGVEALELRTMPQGDDDHRAALITIPPGA
ncbi:MAG: PCRF domain-containing protein, partial [Gemmatimonadetes bacterium]|nr:PCRF domain-containing protein [Gemmatimonadota bacterium]